MRPRLRPRFLNTNELPGPPQHPGRGLSRSPNRSPLPGLCECGVIVNRREGTGGETVGNGEAEQTEARSWAMLF